jgi:hypothetical protein
MSEYASAQGARKEKGFGFKTIDLSKLQRVLRMAFRM